MKTPILLRTVLSDSAVWQILSVSASLAAGLILVLGFHRLGRLEATEAQVFSGVVSTLGLAAVYVVLAVVCHARLTASA